MLWRRPPGRDLVGQCTGRGRRGEAEQGAWAGRDAWADIGGRVASGVTAASCGTEEGFGGLVGIRRGGHGCQEESAGRGRGRGGRGGRGGGGGSAGGWSGGGREARSGGPRAVGGHEGAGKARGPSTAHGVTSNTCLASSRPWNPVMDGPLWNYIALERVGVPIYRGPGSGSDVQGANSFVQKMWFACTGESRSSVSLGCGAGLGRADRRHGGPRLVEAQRPCKFHRCGAVSRVALTAGDEDLRADRRMAEAVPARTGSPSGTRPSQAANRGRCGRPGVGDGVARVLAVPARCRVLRRY